MKTWFLFPFQCAKKKGQYWFSKTNAKSCFFSNTISDVIESNDAIDTNCPWTKICWSNNWKIFVRFVIGHFLHVAQRFSTLLLKSFFLMKFTRWSSHWVDTDRTTIDVGDEVRTNSRLCQREETFGARIIHSLNFRCDRWQKSEDFPSGEKICSVELIFSKCINVDAEEEEEILRNKTQIGVTCQSKCWSRENSQFQ